MRHEFGIDASTVKWTDGRVAQDLEAFPNVEVVERDGREIRQYTDRPDSLDALFREAVQAGPDRDSVVFPELDARSTYAELDEKVDTVAGGLAAAGLSRGDAVAILLPNVPEFVETFLACARLGLVAIPVNTRFSPDELDHVFEDATVEAIITAPSFLDLLAESQYELPRDRVFVVGDSEYRSYDELASGEPPSVESPSEDELVTLLYTSGTTGAPKGCPVTNYRIVNAALNYVGAYDAGEGLRSLCVAPLFHNSGLMGNLVSTFAYVGTVVIREEYTEQTFLETIEDEDIEYVAAAPTIFILLVEREDPAEYDLSSWRLAMYGGAPMSTESIRRVRKALPDGLALSQAYGTTEITGGLATVSPDQYVESRPESVGVPTPVAELKVLGPDDEPLGPGEVGEIAIRGPFVVGEYVNLPEESAETFVGGWQYTGDLGRITDEGFLELKGRSDDMIIRGAENVYPMEVEEALLRHSHVVEASVVGFPDAVLGERVLAAVVPKPDSRVTEGELRAVCEENLSQYKVPDIFRILDEFPRNSSGKITKSELLPEPLKFGIQAGKKDE